MSNSSSPPTVLKFGGAALDDGAGVRRACELVVQRGGTRPIVVVSAAQGVTELLEGLWRAAAGHSSEDGEGATASRDATRVVRIRHRTLLSELGLEPEFLDRHLRELTWILAAIRERGAPSPADRDHVLSFGERMSARIVAACLAKRGVAATPIDAFDLGLLSDSNHGRARPLPENAERVRRALEQVAGVPVVTGFLAVDTTGKLTTLGRNGSDLSASLVGAAVGAGEVQFWKSVGGILTADPELVPDARPIDHLDYDRAAEFARYGAHVLHPDALEPLRLAGIPARVLCFDERAEGDTLIDCDGCGGQAVGLAVGRRWVELRGCPEDLEVEGGLRSDDVIFAPWSDELGNALQALENPVQVDRGWSCLAVLRRTQDAARGVEVLAAVEVEPAACFLEPAATELLVVREADLETAARALHADMIEALPAPSPERAASA